MIDRSREEVATAMIPTIYTIDNGRQWRACGPIALSRHGQIKRARPYGPIVLDRHGCCIAWFPWWDDTLFKIFFILPFRKMCFFQPKINPPYACPRWQAESISGVKQKKSNYKRRNMKKLRIYRKRISSNRRIKKKNTKWRWVITLSAEWVPSSGFSVTVNRQFSSITHN